MRCPTCLDSDSRVLDKREGDALTIRRRRECVKCNRRFTTYERVELANLIIEKKDGRKEHFNREKLIKGISRACNKRPIITEKIIDTVDRIEASIRKKKSDVLSSKVIGELVMRELKKLDGVAYMRFASVYKEFDDLGAFKKELEILMKK